MFKFNFDIEKQTYNQILHVMENRNNLLTHKRKGLTRILNNDKVLKNYDFINWLSNLSYASYFSYIVEISLNLFELYFKL